jgi:hypothetical protein
MLVNVPLKDKNTASTVDCLFRNEICFHKSKHIKRYTLHVRVVTLYHLMGILCVVRT